MIVIREGQVTADGSPNFVGEENGDLGLSVIFVDARRGEGPALHKHPYEEVFIVREGSAAARIGDDEVIMQEGDIVIIPSDTPHAFTATGDGRLRQVNIHSSPRFITEWLEEADRP
jgi:mannose-6-phosphate isomerase-like protein (cupin superfamily)